MNLYTILITFHDYTTEIDQCEAESPDEALEQFVLKGESLKFYDRQLILSIIRLRSKQDNLLIHVANLKGFWIITFGTDLIDVPELASILGGHIVQTDIEGPVR